MRLQCYGEKSKLVVDGTLITVHRICVNLQYVPLMSLISIHVWQCFLFCCVCNDLHVFHRRQLMLVVVFFGGCCWAFRPERALSVSSFSFGYIRFIFYRDAFNRLFYWMQNVSQTLCVKLAIFWNSKQYRKWSIARCRARVKFNSFLRTLLQIFHLDGNCS